MRGYIGFLPVVLLALTTTSTSPAQGTPPDYIFNVPVRIDNAPPFAGQTAYVRCTVMSMDPTGAHYVTGGTATTNFTIGTGGTYHGTVTVAVSLQGAARRADSRSWACSLEFYSLRNAAGAVISFGTPNSVTAVAGYPVIAGQAVASSNLSVGANF